MSWLEGAPGHRKLALGLISLVVAGGLLGGCTSVQPLYGSIGSTNGNGVLTHLRQVDIEVAKSRLSQIVRNELIFDLYGGEGSPDPKPGYKLSVRVNESNVAVGEEKFVDLPSAYLEQLNASFTLTELATQKTVLNGTSFANASYDASDQRFANVRAQRDAQERAGVVIADDIHTKLAAFFATRP